MKSNILIFEIFMENDLINLLCKINQNYNYDIIK